MRGNTIVPLPVIYSDYKRSSSFQLNRSAFQSKTLSWSNRVRKESVCVCVCERERDRESERVCIRERERERE